MTQCGRGATSARELRGASAACSGDVRHDRHERHPRHPVSSRNAQEAVSAFRVAPGGIEPPRADSKSAALSAELRGPDSAEYALEPVVRLGREPDAEHRQRERDGEVEPPQPDEPRSHRLRLARPHLSPAAAARARSRAGTSRRGGRRAGRSSRGRRGRSAVSSSAASLKAKCSRARTRPVAPATARLPQPSGRQRRPSVRKRSGRCSTGALPDRRHAREDERDGAADPDARRRGRGRGARRSARGRAPVSQRAAPQRCRYRLRTWTTSYRAVGVTVVPKRALTA